MTSTAENVVLHFKNIGKYKGLSICNKGVIEMFNRIYKTVPKGMNVVANDMVTYWKKTPDHWIPISVHDAQDYANKGYFVVGGWINPNPMEHGHVVVAVPGKGIVSAKWGGKIPFVLEMGRGIREPKYGLNYSFGSDKISNVVFFYYKQ